MNFINDFIQVKVVDPIGIENILGGNSKIINYNPKVYTPTTKTEISAIPNPSREPTILTIGKNHLYADFSLKEQYKRYNSYLEAKKRNVKPKDKFFIHRPSK